MDWKGVRVEGFTALRCRELRIREARVSWFVHKL